MRSGGRPGARWIGAIVCAVLILPTTMVTARPEASAAITIELNAAAQLDDACRVSFVLVNGLETRVEDLALEIVVFDHAETVRQLMTLSAGAMPPGKTVVRQFDFPGMACTDISRILLNGFAACAGDRLDPVSCLDQVRPSSRIDIAFLS